MRYFTPSAWRIGVAALVVSAVTALPAAAYAGISTDTNLAYEFDNGTTWTLQANTAEMMATYPMQQYSDAGIVIDLGQARDFTGLTFSGSSNLVANIWVGNGTEAYTPGTHLLSDAVDFSYGPWQSGSTFWTGSLAGNSVSIDTIQALGATEIYAWVGITYNGAAESAYINSVNGHSVGHRVINFMNGANNATVAARIY